MQGKSQEKLKKSFDIFYLKCQWNLLYLTQFTTFSGYKVKLLFLVIHHFKNGIVRDFPALRGLAYIFVQATAR